MSQPLSRLFEKWLNAGGDSTFSEWLTERREFAQRLRQVGAVIPVENEAHMRALLHQQQALAQQMALAQQRPTFRSSFENVVVLGGVFRAG